MPLTHEISDYFVSYLLTLIKKVLMKNLNFLLSPIYVPVTLINSKFQIHPVNLRNLDIFILIIKFLLIKWLSKFKLCPLFTRSLNCKKANQKHLILWNLLGSSYKKNVYKKSQIRPSFILCPCNSLKSPKNAKCFAIY